MRRDLSNYGPIPEAIAPEQDTDPQPFGGQAGDDPTVPRCFFCGRSDWDKDLAFEKGIGYAITQMHSLFQQRGMTYEEAGAVADWLRSKLLV